jgi:flagellar biosynthesis protein
MSGLPDSAPNSLATALKREGGESGEQALVLAQGRGAAAEQITAVAAEHNIPVLQDFALSQALQKMPVGTAIPEGLFKALSGLLEYVFREEAELAQQDEQEREAR